MQIYILVQDFGEHHFTLSYGSQDQDSGFLDIPILVEQGFLQDRQQYW